jgi:uncharacterized protein YjbI with pentapeptide repeats
MSFENCRFEPCKFEPAHTYIGGPSLFKDCTFKSCLFDGVQFWKSTFERCSFPSKFVNVVFFGPGAPADWQVKLRDVDFSSAEFELVDFRCGIDLSTTRLPSGFVPETLLPNCRKIAGIAKRGLDVVSLSRHYAHCAGC